MQTLISIALVLGCVAIFFALGLAMAAFRYKMAKKFPDDFADTATACGCGNETIGGCALRQKNKEQKELHVATKLAGKNCVIISMTPPSGNCRLKKYDFQKS